MTPTIHVQREDFDIADEIAAMAAERTDIGAIVTFTGMCRDEEGRLTALELEHYAGMAEAEMARVVEEARGRWPLQGITVIHRYGTIAPGENIVLVVTASTHRRAAFEAAEFLMDYLKTRAPFWKREHLADGTTGAWVEAATQDDVAVERWR
jgi:molybdopterin synthase catalytic subunit